jgi:hypothetical protein
MKVDTGISSIDIYPPVFGNIFSGVYRPSPVMPAFPFQHQIVFFPFRRVLQSPNQSTHINVNKKINQVKGESYASDIIPVTARYMPVSTFRG